MTPRIQTYTASFAPANPSCRLPCRSGFTPRWLTPRRQNRGVKPLLRGEEFAALCAAALLFAAGAVQAVPVLDAPVTPLSSGTGVVAAATTEAEAGPVWRESLASAMGAASMEYKPVLILFSSPGCGWCKRLHDDTLTDAEVLPLLRQFVPVELDVMREPETAGIYGVRSVPTVVLLGSDGAMKAVAEGFLTPPEMKKLLALAVSEAVKTTLDEETVALEQRVRQGRIATNDWPAIMEAMGDKQLRQGLHDAIVGMKPFPAEQLVGLLEHHRLAVRLGALELLEEAVGETHGLDPWTVENGTAREQWRNWAAGTVTNLGSLFTPLGTEQMDGYIRDVALGEPDRALRATAMLRRGGMDVARAVAAFVAANPELATGPRMKLRELRYAILLPPVAGMDSSVLAHRLVFGSADMRQQTLAALEGAGRAAFPVLEEHIADPDPIIRESVADAMVKVSSRGAVDALRARLDVEEDTDVLYACIRALGETRSRKAVATLRARLQHPNEDIVVIALVSLGELGTDEAQDDIATCLTDPRWRVRVAALEAVAKLRLSALTDTVKELLKDSDEFVRSTALKTLVEVGGKDIAPILETLYFENDAMKGTVVAAYCRLNLPLPAAFWDKLEEKTPDTIISVINALQDGREIGKLLAGKNQFIMLRLLGVLLDHPDPDVSAGAMGLVAQGGLRNAFLSGRMARQIREGGAERTRTLLEIFEWPDEDDDPWREHIRGQHAAPAGGDLLRELEQAFVAAGEAAAPEGPDEIVAAMRARLETETNGLLRLVVASRLAELGDPAALPELGRELAQRPVHERESIATALGGIEHSNSLPLLQGLLADVAPTVRRGAAVACARLASNPDYMSALGEALFRTNQPLDVETVYDAFSGGRRLAQDAELSPDVIARVVDGNSSDAPAGTLKEWLFRMVESGNRPDLQTLGLILLEGNWESGDARRVRPLLDSPNPHVRRAAAHAIGKGEPAALLPLINTVVADSSEHVRIVLPSLYTRNSQRWVHMFDEDSLRKTYEWSSAIPGQKLEPELVKAMTTLSDDPVPLVRLQAQFALFSNFEPFDLLAMVTTLDSLADRESAVEWLASFVSGNYNRLGPDFRVLLPLLESGDHERTGRSMEPMLRHFGVDDDAIAVGGIRHWTNTIAPVATYAAAPPPAEEKAQVPRTLPLVFFISPGCGDCARVEDMLDVVESQFPRLSIARHDIHKLDAARYNEALCSRFTVPSGKRQVAPILFAEAGFLARADITPDRLLELVARSAALPATDWQRVGEPDLAAADRSITERSESVSIGLIIGYALLDGVNPCAFATIIFLISYLHVTRRTSREVAQVAFAFIVGVYLTYLAIGLGLAEALTRLLVVQYAGRALDWLMIVVALVLALLNFRDGVLCLRGRMADMTLQLPGLLKTGIHTVIRKASRQRHFVVAAFVMGGVISLLELACTGQMYGPTIAYIVRTQGPLTGAFPLLLLYNAAFVLPLVVIFVLTCHGLRTETLIRILQRHAALVKFLTALLFLVLMSVLLRSALPHGIAWP